MHQVSNFTVESLGRTTRTLGPQHVAVVDGDSQNIRTATWNAYDDTNHAVCSVAGYATFAGSFALVNPVSITISDADDHVTDEIAAVWSGTVAEFLVADVTDFPQTAWQRWKHHIYDDAGQLTATREYFAIPASDDGSSGVNYNETAFGYDSLGRQNKQTTPGGTITRTVFNARGQDVKTYVGTDDTGATDSDPTAGSASGNNIVCVVENVFDGGTCCGSGNLTQETKHVDATPANDRIVNYTYDWRNRLLTASASDGAIVHITANTTIDNLGRVTQTDGYQTAVADANRVSRVKTYYDALNRVYKTETYSVDAATGTVGNCLTSQTWFDASGKPIKTLPAGSQAFSDNRQGVLNGSTIAYNDLGVGDMTGDTLFGQDYVISDVAGNALFTVSYSRNHDATGAGDLTSSNSHVTYSAAWYDAVNRPIASADYGTNGGTAMTVGDRPSVPPTTSDTVPVTLTEYDNVGQAYKTTDPLGRATLLAFDALGRVLSTTQNYVENPVAGGLRTFKSRMFASRTFRSLRAAAPATDENITTAKTYNADGNLATLTAVNPATGNQTTQYIYGTTLSDSDVARNDLLRAVIYPDSTNAYADGVFSAGSGGIYNRLEHCYNRQGEETETTDQNGTVHAFSYDGLGRQTADAVTAWAENVDHAVLRIEQSYEARGMLKNVTSYDAVTAGNVVNDVQLAYSPFSQLAADYQSHSGAVNTSTTPKVQYARADGSANTTRLTDLTYPNGRVVHYHYDVGADGNLSRVSYLSDTDANGQKLAEYTYLGIGQLVIVNYPQPQVQLNLFGGTSGTYSGLDSFGRVVDHRWINNSTTPATDAVRIQHGYNRLGNRLYRSDVVSASQTSPVYQDELYKYDKTNRLVDSQRGQLATTKTAIITNTKTLEQGWSLDQLGNWSGFRNDSDGDGTFDLIQTRMSNAVNEIASIGVAFGSVWATPAYDLAGNMTSMPKTDAPTTSHTCVYDAWNRVVRVLDGATVVAEYAYDGSDRRTIAKKYTSGTLSET